MTTTPTATPQPAQDTEGSIADIARLLDGDLTATVALPPCTVSDAASAQDWLATVRGKRGALRHPRIALFAGRNTAARIASLQSGKDALCALAQDINSDLQVYELPDGTGSDRVAQLHALTYGMMAVQPGLDALALSGLNNDDAPTFANLDDLLASPRADIAAALGALIAARLARVPVLASGAGAESAIKLMERIKAGNAAHVLQVEPLLGVLAGDDSAVNCALALGQVKHLAALASVH